jgi:hypothetical protein
VPGQASPRRLSLLRGWLTAGRESAPSRVLLRGGCRPLRRRQLAVAHDCFAPLMARMPGGEAIAHRSVRCIPRCVASAADSKPDRAARLAMNRPATAGIAAPMPRAETKQPLGRKRPAEHCPQTSIGGGQPSSVQGEAKGVPRGATGAAFAIGPCGRSLGAGSSRRCAGVARSTPIGQAGGILPEHRASNARLFLPEANRRNRPDLRGRCRYA